ncbi:hypothetical protein BJ138DRAFT_923215 [Hygrophoropsis aurantiaca]|uniref:Uncharacterized protein n=1 Tax=Hygrophoropsis aurantiaca TaxID=72124 RepID=A0ACB7ZUT2_9AGAM|nr:hypothetical protein BJ138DRAFT_923215 [Hygrophoropsis aurantiaca]
MPSFLSRFRNRAISQNTATSSLSASSGADPATPSARQENFPENQVSPPFPYPLGGKILEDPNSYLDLKEDESQPHGLTPSTRRHSIDGSGRGLFYFKRPQPMSDGTLNETEEHEGTTKGSTNNTFVGQPGLIGRLSQFTSGGEWSTFGRHRGRHAPKVGSFSQQSSPRASRMLHSYSPSLIRNHSHKRNKVPSLVGSVQSIATANRSTNASHPSTVAHDFTSESTSTNRRSPVDSSDNLHNSKQSSPTNTMSSRRHPRTPNRPRSNTTPAIRPSRSFVTQFTTPVVRELGFDSPRTFGYPTPPENRSMFVFPSPPPPMPALDHPELTAALSSRSNPSTSVRGMFARQSRTLPRRQSKELSSRNRDDFFLSLSHSFGHSVRHHSSLYEIFPSVPDQRRSDQPRPRARTISGRIKHGRRSSADWSARQATVGVNSKHDHSWPAEVSRQILRLSLGQSGDIGDNGVRGSGIIPGSSSEYNAQPRGESMQAVALISRPPSFSPSPIHPPARQHPSIPLEGSVALTFFS